MRFLSVCSGIEAASVAWSPLGWQAVAFAEIEPFPCAVLARHYPGVPNRGDMTKFQEWPDADVDVLCGGTPCQSFSVAGLRQGLRDPRGNLALTFLAIAARYQPRWIVWENVPGLLSSDGGRDFGAFLGGLAKLGYGFAYRVLDAQHFGVPQRRRRVFVVGCLGDWRRAAAVLLERESLSGNPPPRREAGAVVTQSLTGGPHSSSAGNVDDNRAQGGFCIPVSYDGNDTRGPIDVATAVNAHGGPHGRLDFESETFVAHSPVAFDWRAGGETSCGTSLEGCPPVRTSDTVAVAFSCKDHGADAGDTSPTLRAMGHDGSHANAGGQVAVTTLAIRGRGDSHDLETRQDGTANAILTPNGGRAGIGVGAVHYHTAVRRLTPTECERLQGFPDGYTAIQYRGKPASDGPRYKALGNSWAVPVARWIGERINLVEDLTP